MTARNQLGDEGYDYINTVTADPAVLKTQVDALAEKRPPSPRNRFSRRRRKREGDVFGREDGYVVDANALLKRCRSVSRTRLFPIQMSAKAIALKATAEELREKHGADR